jgi:hypothetical protein
MEQMLGEKIAATKSMQTYHISTFVRTIQHQSQGVQLHGHGDLDQVGEHDDKVKLVAAESKQEVATGVFQQVQLLHLLVSDSAQNSKISVTSAVRIHGL